MTNQNQVCAIGRRCVKGCQIAVPGNQSIVAICASTTGSRRLCPPRTSSMEATKATTTCRLGSSFAGVEISVQVSPTSDEIQQSHCSGAEFQPPPTNTTCNAAPRTSGGNKAVALQVSRACCGLPGLAASPGLARRPKGPISHVRTKLRPKSSETWAWGKLASLFGQPEDTRVWTDKTLVKQRRPDVFHRACWPQPTCDVDKSLHGAFSGVAQHRRWARSAPGLQHIQQLPQRLPCRVKTSWHVVV